MTNFTPWPIYPVQKASSLHWVQGCVEPSASLSVVGKIYYTIIIIIISIQPEGRFWQEPEPSQATGMALAHCHCFPPPLDVPTFASRCLHVQATWETSISERRARNGRSILPVISTSTQICDQGRRAVDFFARKIRRLRLWVPEASMLTTRPPKPPAILLNVRNNVNMA